MAYYFKKAVWLLHELSAAGPAGRFADAEFSWTNREKTISCNQEAIRNWDKSISIEAGQTRQVKARIPSVHGDLIQKYTKGVRASFNGDARNSGDSSHLMYRVTLTFIAADRFLLSNIYFLPAICF